MSCKELGLTRFRACGGCVDVDGVGDIWARGGFLGGGECSAKVGGRIVGEGIGVEGDADGVGEEGSGGGV